jgi:hypothetical protein
MGSGVGGRGGEGAFDAGGADIGGLKAEFGPDRAGEGRDRGLAVGAGDGGDGVGLASEPEGGGKGESLARVFGDDQGGGGCVQFGARDVGPGAVGQDGPCAHPQGILDEFAAVDFGPGKGREKMAGLDQTAVHRQAGHDRLAPRLRGQTQIGQWFRGQPHRSCSRVLHVLVAHEC